MVAIPRKRLTLPLAPLVAGALAVVVALIFALLPAALLGSLVLDSGIAALVPAAEPPLGATARAALILIGGGGLGLIAWFAAFLLIGTRSVSIGGPAEANDLPVLRRADAHPDAPARRPLFATQDLGTPFLDVRAPVHIVAPETAAVVEPLAAEPTERSLPADLDMPLSAYDPDAIPAHAARPMAMPAPAPRPQVFDDGEAFETFAAAPMVEPKVPEPEPVVEPEPAPHLVNVAPLRLVPDEAPASIQSLLDRFEKGVTRRTPAAEAAPAMGSATPQPHKESLQESLASLRRMAISR